MSNWYREISNLLESINDNTKSAIDLAEVDMGQAKSVQDRENEAKRPAFWTPEEEKEVRAIRNNPKFHDDDEEGEALVARLRAMKKKANDRYNKIV